MPAATMFVGELWRYPVKSMAGEPLLEAEIRKDGIVGDRLVHVRSAAGRVVTSRTRPRLLGHRATLSAAGEPLVDGRPWSSPEVARDVEQAVGQGARLVRYEGVERFDVPCPSSRCRLRAGTQLPPRPGCGANPLPLTLSAQNSGSR